MKHLFAAAVLALTALGASAHEFKVGNIRVVHPYAVPSLQAAPNGMGFVDLTDRGAQGDKLLGASSPVAARVEIHEMKVENGIMKMREVPGIDVPAGQTVRMADSGLHLMLMELKAPLKAGDKFPLILRFAQAGELRIEVWVQDKAAGSKAMHDHHLK